MIPNNAKKLMELQKSTNVNYVSISCCDQGRWYCTFHYASDIEHTFRNAYGETLGELLNHFTSILEKRLEKLKGL